MKYILALQIPKQGTYWGLISTKYSYKSIRRALQAKKEWQKWWDSTGIKVNIRIEHFYA